MSATKVNGRPRVQVATESSTGGLAEALLAFHAKAPKLKRDAEGQIQSRTYGYTTLDGLLDVVEPLLMEHGLLWTAKVTIAEGQPAALYEMKHVPSGESEEWVGPLPCVGPGPQNLGSAITYMRRYTLQAYLNLAPGEDDDGAAASNTPSNTPSNTTTNTPSNATQPTAAPATGGERPASVAQRKMLRAKARAAELTDVQFANAVMVAKGEQARDSDDQDAAKRYLDRELDHLPARLVDGVIAGIEGPKP